MKCCVLCIVIPILTQNLCASSTDAPQTEWRLDYASGDGVLVDTDHKVQKRCHFHKVSNLRYKPSDSTLVLGSIDYTQDNGTPLTLTFESKLETYAVSQQNDDLLHLKVRVEQCCLFAGKVYHLPPRILSVTPYTLIPNSASYTNTNVDEASLRVTFTQTVHYIRPLDSSEYVHSRQLTVPIQRTLLRYIYADDKKAGYPIYQLSASHNGYELVNKEVTAAQSTPYKLVRAGKLIRANIEPFGSDRIATIIIDEWLRPLEEHPIQLSRRIELPVRVKTSYSHDDANLCSTKTIKSYVEYSAETIKISETSEIIPYQKVVMPHTVGETIHQAGIEIYNRPDGTRYKKPLIDRINVEEFVVL